MLVHVLRANAASCAIFGLLFVVAGPATADFIGNPPVLLLWLLGAGLLINAALLIWTSLSAQPDRASVLSFAAGDAAWVLATVALVLAGFWITTPAGIIWSIGVAVFVGGCGLLQWKLAPAADNS